MNEMTQRARNAMHGLAIGDASSWPAMYHRSVLLPFWTRRIRREIDATSETTNVIVAPMPFSLNQEPERFNISPTDDSEWAAFSADIVLAHRGGDYARTVRDAWLTLAQTGGPIRGGVSTQAALQNLRNGIEPPQSGKENPHYCDDGAMPRAVPIGIVCAGHPDAAARLAATDACVTNSEDGVWAAQAMAVAVSIVCAGGSIDEAIAQARRSLPAASWIGRIVDEAMTIADKGEPIFALLPAIQDTIVNREYSYGNLAPETLALTFMIAKVEGASFSTAVMTSTGIPKCGESLPAMVGALTGAMQPMAIAGSMWLKAIGTLNGICIPAFAGKQYLALTEHIAHSAGQMTAS